MQIVMLCALYPCICITKVCHSVLAEKVCAILVFALYGELEIVLLVDYYTALHLYMF